jgi:hypothetical protein
MRAVFALPSLKQCDHIFSNSAKHYRKAVHESRFCTTEPVDLDAVGLVCTAEPADLILQQILPVKAGLVVDPPGGAPDQPVGLDVRGAKDLIVDPQ